MNSELILAYLRDPSLLEKEDTAALEEIVKEYPYFQTAQFLLAKQYQLAHHPNYEKQVQRAAVYAADRTKLFELLHSAVNKESLEIQQGEFILSNNSGGNAEFIPSDILLQEEENDELLREEDPEMESVAVMEEEFILRDLDFEFQGKEIEKISEVEFPRQLEADNAVDATILPEEFGEVEVMYEMEDAWVTREESEVEEDIILSNEKGGASEFIATDIEEDPSNENPVSLASESQSLMWLESGEEPVAERSISISEQTEPARDQVNSAVPEEQEFRINEQVDSPGEFLPQKSFTFLQWLNFFKSDAKKENKKSVPPLNVASEKKQTEKKEEPVHPEVDEKLNLTGIQTELETIDKIVSTMKQEGLEKQEGEISPAELAKKSLELDQEMVSETLAQIYEQQGRYDKAIRMYARLSLKFPEKLAFFAARIKEIKSKK